MNLFIISGSTLGTAEYASEEVKNYCSNELDLDCVYVNGPSLADVETATHIVVICSTHGEGDYPDNFQAFADQVAAKDKPFQANTKFLLVGIGSTAYDQFCNAIKKFNKLVTEKGYTVVDEPLYIDMDNFENDPDALTLQYFIDHKDSFLN